MTNMYTVENTRRRSQRPSLTEMIARQPELWPQDPNRVLVGFVEGEVAAVTIDLTRRQNIVVDGRVSDTIGLLETISQSSMLKKPFIPAVVITRDESTWGKVPTPPLIFSPGEPQLNKLADSLIQLTVATYRLLAQGGPIPHSSNNLILIDDITALDYAPPATRTNLDWLLENGALGMITSIVCDPTQPTYHPATDWRKDARHWQSLGNNRFFVPKGEDSFTFWAPEPN